MGVGGGNSRQILCYSFLQASSLPRPVPVPSFRFFHTSSTHFFGPDQPTEGPPGAKQPWWKVSWPTCPDTRKAEISSGFPQKSAL